MFPQTDTIVTHNGHFHSLLCSMACFFYTEAYSKQT